ncbi:hypothetical protein CDAR_370991 [Caerostris darwini]|uniref:Uncharacterized protein n=1 Tax=Caerostris darwini TaxID=1538125 RepID=A0AAV4NBM8_9ARAC|nr:hypothetical protein CDAR_370991 [Caerostris darwini]
MSKVTSTLQSISMSDKDRQKESFINHTECQRPGQRHSLTAFDSVDYPSLHIDLVSGYAAYVAVLKIALDISRIAKTNS